jgi:hypothetical protein
MCVMLARVLALVLAVAMPALTGASRDGGWVPYVNDRFGFSFRYPTAALMYPVAAKRVFDPVIEGIENSFRPGQRCISHADR